MSPLIVVVWTCVAVFLATAVITLAALIGWIRCLGGGDCKNHHFYLKRLFGALIIEIAGVSVAAYAEAFSSNDREQLEKISKEIQKQGTETVAAPRSVPSASTPTPRQVLQQKAYATSNGPASDAKVIKIPEGWRYVDSKTNVWTKTAGGNFAVTSLRAPGSDTVTEVKLVATAEKQKVFGPRHWVGVDLNVVIEKLP